MVKTMTKEWLEEICICGHRRGVHSDVFCEGCRIDNFYNTRHNFKIKSDSYKN